MIKKVIIKDFDLESGQTLKRISLSYQVFGRDLNSAPVVLVNHSLTGNSNVCGPSGWWRKLIGPGQIIDTDSYSIVAFNIPGNGYVSGDYDDKNSVLRIGDVAKLFVKGLMHIDIQNIYAIIGGSIGGGIGWEIIAEYPEFTEYLITIGSHWRSSDWVKGQCHVQGQILKKCSDPLSVARMMAMLFYRSPQSFDQKFSNGGEGRDVVSWLEYHGKKLFERYSLDAYLTMNQLLGTINVANTEEEFRKKFRLNPTKIIQVGISSDILFPAQNNRKTKMILDEINVENEYLEIISPHGHDAFLIEYEQLGKLLKRFFRQKNQTAQALAQ